MPATAPVAMQSAPTTPSARDPNRTALVVHAQGQAQRARGQPESLRTLLQPARIVTVLVFLYVYAPADPAVVIDVRVEEIRDAEVRREARRQLLRERRIGHA